MSKKFNTLDAPLKVRTSAALNPNHSDYHLEDLETLSSNADTDKLLIVDANGRAYQQARSDLNTGWRDMLTSLGSGKVPAQDAPTWAAFGPSGGLFAYKFAVTEYIFSAGMHVQHDVLVGGKTYFHVHFASSGTNTGMVTWEIEYSIAAGHNQAAFPAPSTVTGTQAASSTAWQHQIAEVSDNDAFTTPEVDALILAKVKRVSASPECTDDVFGLFLDCHYQVDRMSTPSKSPDFYT